MKFVYDEIDVGPHSDKYEQDYTEWTCGGTICTIPAYAFWAKAGVTTTFTYNGDGARVKKDVAGVGTTFYLGNVFEVYVPDGGAASVNKYFYFGSQRAAAKIGADLFYLQSDHLGSTSVVMKDTGDLHTHQTYFPYGEPRNTEGSPLPTDFTFTGQKNDASTDLMFYGARYYDATLGRFIQADTIVPNPGDPQSLNRYAYGLNNPVKYVDPTGHEAEAPACQSWDSWCWENRYWTAQGKCYSQGSGEWTRECAPNISDPAMLGQVIRDNPDILLRGDTNVAFDPTGVVKFIWGQMIQNAQGQEAAILRTLNSCGVSGMTCSEQAIASLIFFADLVKPGGRWDFKHLLRDQFGGRWQEVNGFYYNHDIWSNIHFGYVGLAAGFSVGDLIHGAGLAEIFTDVKGGIRSEPRIPGEAWPGAFDQPRDRAAVLVGMALWLDNGLAVQMSDIVDAIQAAPGVEGLRIKGR